MRIINYINGMQGVAAGAVATLDIPVNRRYHALKLFVSGTFNAAPSTNPEELISSVQLLVNGVVIRDLRPGDVIKIAKLNGITPDTTNGETPFYFSEPWRASVIGEESTSWDMFGQQKFTLQVTFNSVSVTGAFPITNLAAAVEASFDYGRNYDDKGQFFLAIVKQLRFGYSAPIGSVDLTNLPMQFPIQRIHFSPSTGTLSSLIVYNNSIKAMEGLTAQLNDFYKDFKLVPASGFALSAIFDHTQQISDALKVENNSLDVQPVCSAANNLTVIVEHRANGYV